LDAGNEWGEYPIRFKPAKFRTWHPAQHKIARQKFRRTLACIMPAGFDARKLVADFWANKETARQFCVNFKDLSFYGVSTEVIAKRLRVENFWPPN
jgi:hypothetical protein